MKILLISNPYFKKAFERMGHEVTFLGGDDAEYADVHHYPADLIFVHETLGSRHFPHGIERVGAVTVFYGIDVHLNLYWHKEYAQVFDYVFVTQKDYVRLLQHDSAYWLPASIDSDIFNDQNLQRIHDIVFVGTVDTLRRKRKNILATLSKKLSVYIAGEQPTKRLTPAEICRLYSQAKIVVNESILNDVNYRVFEALACGALLLTERVNNGLLDLFQDGEEIVVFNPEDLLDKAAFYLHHETERVRIARNGYRRVHHEHTVYARAQQVFKILEASGYRMQRCAHDRAALCLGKTLFYAATRFAKYRKRRFRRAELFLQTARKNAATHSDAELFLELKYLCLNEEKKYTALIEHMLSAAGEPLTKTQAALLCSILYQGNAPEAASALLTRLVPSYSRQTDDFYFTLGKLFESLKLEHCIGYMSICTVPLCAVDCYLMSSLTTKTETGFCAAAEIFFRNGAFDSACEYLEAALRLNPHHKIIQQQLAQVYKKIYLNDAEKAVRDFLERGLSGRSEVSSASGTLGVI